MGDRTLPDPVHSPRPGAYEPKPSAIATIAAMRLLYVVPNPQRIGGVARSTLRILDSLRAAEHEVAVVASEAEDENPQMELRGLLLGSTLQGWTDRTLAGIERFRPDLVVGYYGSKGAFAAVAAARLAGLPSVACLRGNDVNLDFFSALHHHLTAFAVTHADAVAVVSTEMRHKVARWLGAEAAFISNSVDPESFRPDPEGAARLRREWGLGEGPVVGLFGELKPSKGLAVLPGLRPALAGATTLVIGEVRPESRREVPDWVRTVPYIADRATLCAAYSLCDLVLQPSLHDGMPNTALEAMACGRVVVGSRAGGLPDLIRDGENGFLAGPEEWPRVVARLLADPPPAVGEAARRSVPLPAQERHAFVDLFERVLARR
ncbi:MAG TPA: glycosyltransferase family 4 protein [Thermoanaerobaculia bacterium]|nr:glycosyltransferase family 4 protein [Thermoanaerobaculia bacterium]